jgi:hypothetical protein
VIGKEALLEQLAQLGDSQCTLERLESTNQLELLPQLRQQLLLQLSSLTERAEQSWKPEEPDQLIDTLIRCFEQTQARTMPYCQARSPSRGGHRPSAVVLQKPHKNLHCGRAQRRALPIPNVLVPWIPRTLRTHSSGTTTLHPHGPSEATPAGAHLSNEPRPHGCWRRRRIDGLHQPEPLRSSLSGAIRGTPERHTRPEPAVFRLSNAQQTPGLCTS